MSGVDQARRLMSGLALTLRETREQEALTVRALSEQTGIPVPYISYIENSLWIPTPEQHQILTQWLLEHPLLNGKEQPC